MTALTTASKAGLPKKMENKVFSNQGELSLVTSNLAGAAPDARTFYITSCFPQDGKTLAAISMACGAASHGSAQTLLIDGNTKRPMLHQHFDIPLSPGLSEAARETAPLENAIHGTRYSGLYVMPLGADGASAKELSSELLAKVLERLKVSFDYIIVDGQSVMKSAGGTLATRAFDATVLVAVCERTKWDVINMAQEKIRAVGGNPCGLVLNRRRFYIPRFFYRKS